MLNEEWLHERPQHQPLRLSRSANAQTPHLRSPSTTQPFDSVDAAPSAYPLLHPSPRVGPASLINVRPCDGHTLIHNHAHSLSITTGTIPGIKNTHSGALREQGSSGSLVL